MNLLFYLQFKFIYQYILGVIFLATVFNILAHVFSLSKFSIRDLVKFGLLLAISLSALCWVISAGASGEASVSFVVDVKKVLDSLLTGISIFMLCIGVRYKSSGPKGSVSELSRQKNLPSSMVSTVIVLVLGIITSSIAYRVGTPDWSDTRLYIWELSVALVILLLGVTLSKYICAYYRLSDNWRQDNEQGNSAQIIRCAGQLLAVSISITTAVGLTAFLPSQILLFVLTLLAWSIFLTVITWILCRYAHLLFLNGINSDKSDKNKNIAFIEAIICIGIATIFKNILT